MPDQSAATAPPLSRAVLRGLVARQAVPLLTIGVVIWLLQERIAELDLSSALDATRSIAPGQWLATALATAVSFWAVGRYDAVVHRLLGSPVTGAEARRAGIAAIATSQAAGFGLLTGTLARWRMLPELTLWQAARITVCVTLSFMAGLAVVCAAASLLAGQAGPLPAALAWAALLAAAAFAALSLWRPRRLLHLPLPPLRAQAAILGLVALDTGAAACALYVLLPAEGLPPLMDFFPVFMLALGAGMIGATPGGVGPFELVCLGLLTTTPEPALLAAIAGYRLVYYGLPGALALALLLAGRQRASPRPQDRARLRAPSAPLPGAPLDALLHRAPRAEAQLLRQGELDLLCLGARPLAAAAAAGQCLLVLGDPLSRDTDPALLLASAREAARDRNLTPCLYKCLARTAAAARAAGWRVAAVSDEAWIAPTTHDLQQPACRQLRRLLRKADKAGLRVAEAGAFLPIQDMSCIAESWTRRRGGARGFSLGRFAPRLLSRQRVFLCHDADRRLVAFATFHVAHAEWTLDQMCQTEGTPPGAMQLLIAEAIAAARRQACPRLSLAAVPRPVPRWLPRTLAGRLDARSGAAGLAQFKSAFAPHWRPLYLVAPSRLALALGGIDLADRITRPGRRDRRMIGAAS